MIRMKVSHKYGRKVRPSDASLMQASHAPAAGVEKQLVRSCLHKNASTDSVRIRNWSSGSEQHYFDIGSGCGCPGILS